MVTTTWYTVELVYNVLFCVVITSVVIRSVVITSVVITSVVITEEYNVMVNSEELIRTTERLTLYTGCRNNRYRYNRVRLHFRDCCCSVKWDER